MNLIPTANLGADAQPAAMPPINKTPARIRVVFLYPPADVVNAGKNEDGWAPHRWFTWPGNQFQPEAQEQTFTRKIKEMADRIGLDVAFAPKAVYQDAKVREYIADTKASGCDGVVVVNFWNTFAKWSLQIAAESAPTAIVYQPVGSNHQLPPADLRNAEGIFYIHSIENWDEIERGLRAVHTSKMLAQSRLLRVTANPPKRHNEKKFGVDVVGADAAEFNSLFDAVKLDDPVVREAMAWKQKALGVTDVVDEYFVEAMRSHRAVQQIMQRYAADAITINCLMLQHRKPCLSFATNNGLLIPCGCENDFNATLTMMIGRLLFERGGFQHNPEFDTSRNQYFASHCTCTTKLKGPVGASQDYFVRPFFHQLPKTAALDVQWTPDEPVTLVRYNSADDSIACWTGKVINSPASPPTGGCATRVLVDIDKVDDVCDIYTGPHPILYCADKGMARRVKVLAKIQKISTVGNI